MQSFGFYSQLAWISPSYEDRGWSARDAGLLLALWSIVQLASGLGVPVLADRMTDRRPLVAASVCCGLLGLVGVLVAPDSAPVVWVTLMGLGQGGGFAVAWSSWSTTRRRPRLPHGCRHWSSWSPTRPHPWARWCSAPCTMRPAGSPCPTRCSWSSCSASSSLVPRLRPGRLTEQADAAA